MSDFKNWVLQATNSASASRGKRDRESQPPAPILTANITYEMASHQLRLLELLQIEGVRSDTYAILTALLRRCANDSRLSAFVLCNIDEQIREQGHIFNLATLHGLARCVSCPPTDRCARMRRELLRLVADALNHEAQRWMSDFLLIGN
jgi:hypothetical protein